MEDRDLVYPRSDLVTYEVPTFSGRDLYVDDYGFVAATDGPTGLLFAVLNFNIIVGGVC